MDPEVLADEVDRRIRALPAASTEPVRREVTTKLETGRKRA
jgi:hypothetical protein